MGVESLQVGNKLQLSDGSTVEVTGTPKQRAVPVRVVDSPFGTDRPGDDKVVDADEIYGVYTDDALSGIRAL